MVNRRSRLLLLLFFLYYISIRSKNEKREKKMDMRLYIKLKYLIIGTIDFLKWKITIIVSESELTERESKLKEKKN